LGYEQLGGSRADKGLCSDQSRLGNPAEKKEGKVNLAAGAKARRDEALDTVTQYALLFLAQKSVRRMQGQETLKSKHPVKRRRRIGCFLTEASRREVKKRSKNHGKKLVLTNPALNLEGATLTAMERKAERKAMPQADCVGNKRRRESRRAS